MAATDRLKQFIPWFVKIPVKIALSRLPIQPRSWQRLNLFRAGTMDNPADALNIFMTHLSSTGLDTLRGRTVLELGPGNSSLTALFARSMGAARTWLVDSEPLASQNVRIFGLAEQVLEALHFPSTGVGNPRTVQDALQHLNAVYLTEGLSSLQTIPDKSVDFLFSNAVMEHIRLSDFEITAREMRRVLKPDGAASHQIDFRDHLQNSLNNLRFSERMWESRFMSRSGFYTNRLSWPAMREVFQRAGFHVELKSADLWPNGLPTPQRRMSRPFRDMAPEDLRIRGAHVVLRLRELRQAQGSVEKHPHQLRLPV